MGTAEISLFINTEQDTFMIQQNRKNDISDKAIQNVRDIPMQYNPAFIPNKALDSVSEMHIKTV